MNTTPTRKLGAALLAFLAGCSSPTGKPPGEPPDREAKALPLPAAQRPQDGETDRSMSPPPELESPAPAPPLPSPQAGAGNRPPPAAAAPPAAPPLRSPPAAPLPPEPEASREPPAATPSAPPPAPLPPPSPTPAARVVDPQRPRMLYPPEGGEALARSLHPLLEWTPAGEERMDFEVELEPLPDPESVPSVDPPSRKGSRARTTLAWRRWLDPLRAGGAYQARVRLCPRAGGREGPWSEPALLRIAGEEADRFPVRAVEPRASIGESHAVASPDGRWVASIRGGLQRADLILRRAIHAENGEVSFSFEPRGGPSLRWPGPVAWLGGGEDGWALLFSGAGSAEAGAAAFLYRWDLAGGPAVRIGAGSLAAKAGRVSASSEPGGRIYYEAPEGGEIWSALPDGSHRELVAEGSEPQVSSDGRLLAFISERGGASNVWLQRLGGAGGLRSLTQNQTPGTRLEGPAWSPGMDRIAYAADCPGDPRGTNLDLFTVEIETGEVEVITRSLSDDRNPAFLPDGEGGAAGLLFSSTRVGGPGLFFAALRTPPAHRPRRRRAGARRRGPAASTPGSRRGGSG